MPSIFRRALYTGGAVVALVLLAAFVIGRAGERSIDYRLALTTQDTRAVFPLRVSASGRHLVDASGRPFLVHGDTAWSLIADLTREEVEIYLADRRARGFNAILVNLVEHKFARKAPANIYGEQPFVRNDFAAPNEAYFAHADWVLERARSHGFLVLLAPAYLGWQGGEEGWWREMSSSGERALYAYGRFLGQRYRSFDNIVWVNGGDYDPPDRALVRAIAMGLKETAPEHLHTIHLAPDSFSMEFADAERWVDIATVYTYDHVCPAVLRSYLHPVTRPVLMFESAYENEHGADDLRVRRQAYESLLCGAAGHIFGNNPIWHFNHPGLHRAPADWWRSLGSPGAQSMTRLIELFAGLEWWKLEPDAQGRALVDAGAQAPATAAIASDGTFALAYVTSPSGVVVDPGVFRALTVLARWFDPSAGTLHEPAVELDAAHGKRTLAPPGNNSSGRMEWLLVLAAAGLKLPDALGASVAEADTS